MRIRWLGGMLLERIAVTTEGPEMFIRCLDLNKEMVPEELEPIWPPRVEDSGMERRAERPDTMYWPMLCRVEGYGAFPRPAMRMRG
jgi:hypothetical protein